MAIRLVNSAAPDREIEEDPQRAVRELTTLCWAIKNMWVVYRMY